MRSTRKSKAMHLLYQETGILSISWLDEDDDMCVDPDVVDKGDEISIINRFGDKDGSDSKWLKKGINIIFEELDARVPTLDLISRKIMFGRPLSGNTYHLCGVIKLFTDLWYEFFYYRFV